MRQAMNAGDLGAYGPMPAATARFGLAGFMAALQGHGGASAAARSG